MNKTTLIRVNRCIHRRLKALAQAKRRPMTQIIEFALDKFEKKVKNEPRKKD